MNQIKPTFYLSWAQAFQAGAKSAGGKGWNLGRLARYGFNIPTGGVLSTGAYNEFLRENQLVEIIKSLAPRITLDNIGEKTIEDELARLREKIQAGIFPEALKVELFSGLSSRDAFSSLSPGGFIPKGLNPEGRGLGGGGVHPHPNPPPSRGREFSGICDYTPLLEKPVAVRSSASAEDTTLASFAGIHESFLNVRGLNNILEAIKRCYASLWTPRAVAYRRKMKIPDQEVIPAVVIMEMVEVQAAGIAFTFDPQSGRQDILMINANYGLGESVVGGAVEPDEYRVDSFYLDIKSKKIGRKHGMTVALKEGGTSFMEFPQVRKTDSSPSPGGFIPKGLNPEGRGLGGGVNHPHPDPPPSRGRESSGEQVLSDENIQKLALLTLRVFEALGNGEQHQDIEWAFDGQEFILLQARPVTVIPRYTFEEIKDQPDYWSNANFRDSAPMVLPKFNWSLIKRRIDSILDAPFKIINYPLPEGLQHVRLFQGRGYFNLSFTQWSWYDALGLLPKETNLVIGGHQPEIKIKETQPYRGVRGWKRRWRYVKFLLAMMKYKGKAPRSFQKVTEASRIFLQKDLKVLDEQGLIQVFFELDRTIIEYAPMFAMLTGSTAPFGIMVQELEKCFPQRGHALGNALMAGGAKITSADHGYRLLELAAMVHQDPEAQSFFEALAAHQESTNCSPSPGGRGLGGGGTPTLTLPHQGGGNLIEPPFRWESLPDNSPFKQAFKNFLEEYGHRGVYEMEISNPRWREDPLYPLHIIRQSINSVDLTKIRTQQTDQAAKARQEIKLKVPFIRRLLINYLLKQALSGAEMREKSKSVLVMPLESLRLALLEVGRRFEERGILRNHAEVFNLSWHEILSILKGDWNGQGAEMLIAERKQQKAELEKLTPPDLIVDDAPEYARAVEGFSGDFLTGIGVATGKGEGAARLIHHPDEGEKLKAGEVLVAPSTEPSWSPLFLRAAALIMETGGTLSHGAIVAREYGIPAVVNVPGVMKLLKDEQPVVVDGDEGRVYLKGRGKE